MELWKNWIIPEACTDPKWIKGSNNKFHLYSELGQRQQVLAKIPQLSLVRSLSLVCRGQGLAGWLFLVIKYSVLQNEGQVLSSLKFVYSLVEQIAQTGQYWKNKGILEIKAVFVPHTGGPLSMFKWTVLLTVFQGRNLHWLEWQLHP